LDVLQTLLQRGASIDEANDEGCTALHFACKESRWPLAHFLLENFANVNIKDKQGATSFRYASMAVEIPRNYTIYLNVLRLLLQHGATIDEQNDSGWTALHFACKKRRWRLAHFLLEHFANVNIKDNQGLNPLHFACTADIGAPHSFDLVQMILDRGANINEQNEKGWTVLHIAANDADLELTRLLLRNGADTCIFNYQKDTPLSLCFPERAKSMQIADQLLDYGACHKNPTLEGMMWDWKHEQSSHCLRSKCLLNWYYFQPHVHFHDAGLLYLAIVALNEALSLNMLRNAKIPMLGNVTNSSDIVAAMVSIMYDLVQNNYVSILSDHGTVLSSN
jgi:ankyrin repeat protein